MSVLKAGDELIGKLRIGIVGAPSAGKTTTAHLVRHKLSAHPVSREVVREYARHYIEKYGQPRTAFEQWHIYDGQTKWEQQAVDVYQVVLSDSPRFLPYLYSLQYLDHRESREVACVTRLYELAILALNDYDRIYVLAPNLDVEQDGVRSQKAEDAIAIDAMIRQFLWVHTAVRERSRPHFVVEVPQVDGKDPEAYAQFVVEDLAKDLLRNREPLIAS